MENQLDKLTKLGTVAVESAIESYTKWVIVSSICWIVAGILFAWIAVWLWRRLHRSEDMDMEGEVILGIGVFFATLIVAIIFTCNLPDLIQPRAAAIHHLITDASGSKK